MVVLGLGHLDQFAEIVRHREAGTIPPTVMWGACPTLFDPSQAPPGKHTAFTWEKLPYRVHGDPANWDRIRDAHGQDMLKVWRRFAPNLEGAVIDRFTRSPLDVERTFPNMRYGDLLVGAFAHTRSATTGRFPAPVATAAMYRASTCAARAVIRAATSRACPATTPPRSWSPISASLPPRSHRRWRGALQHCRPQASQARLDANQSRMWRGDLG